MANWQRTASACCPLEAFRQADGRCQDHCALGELAFRRLDAPAFVAREIRSGRVTIDGLVNDSSKRKSSNRLDQLWRREPRPEDPVLELASGNRRQPSPDHP